GPPRAGTVRASGLPAIWAPIATAHRQRRKRAHLPRVGRIDRRLLACGASGAARPATLRTVPPGYSTLVAAGRRGHVLGRGAPDIDAGEQEQPHHGAEGPVRGGELEAEMLLGRELSELGGDQADDEDRRADDHVRAVEAGRHEEGGAVDVAREVEAGVAVFVGLHRREGETKRD